MKINIDFYKGKRVLVTGHTGFKGSWLCKILCMAGAQVTGYALAPPTEPNLYTLAGIDRDVRSVIGDIRDFDALYAVFDEVKPEIVFHLAAQPLVRESYDKPQYTYETNVMGAVNVLECIRLTDSVKSFLNVTTDKVYKDDEQRRHSEDDPLDGYDPYSNSKSCSELVTHSYKNSFFTDGSVAVSTARAGNVIGGGDFAKDRIIPDCVRAAIAGTDITVRNPYSSRAFQHVLDPLFVYLMIAQKQYDDILYEGSYNVAPDECDSVSTGELVQMFCDKWGGIKWTSAAEENAPHEAGLLKLDCGKLKKTFGWRPTWNIDKAVEKTVEWTRAYISGNDINTVMEKQIIEFQKV